MCDNRQTVDYSIMYKPHRSPPQAAFQVSSFSSRGRVRPWTETTD